MIAPSLRTAITLLATLLLCTAALPQQEAAKATPQETKPAAKDDKAPPKKDDKAPAKVRLLSFHLFP
jgi:hypothetical protein